jgi:hypothetical protein
MNPSQSLLEALFQGKSRLTRIPNTKNDCFNATSSKGSKIFLKVFKDEQSAFNEFRLLRFLKDKHSQASSFRVPAILDFLDVERHYVIVSEFIAGHTVREILMSTSENAFSICGRMVYATAEIHSSLSGNSDISLPVPRGHTFHAAQDIQPRLETLIYQEGSNVLTTAEIQRILQLQDRFLGIIAREGNGFPCDYYKDSNPANWILRSTSNELIAVDFEGNRQLPFWVDLINILEYAKDYLGIAEKQMLVDYYIEIREKLLPNWGAHLQNFDLQTMYCLFGVYRHHEQMLHRIRDLARSISNADKNFHLNGLFYHLSRLNDNLEIIRALSTLSETEKQDLRKDISEIYNTYTHAIYRTLRKEV